MKFNGFPPRFFYITGCDGSGKTTQAALLAHHLRQKGHRVRQVWLRFPFLLCLPLLAYARLRRMSWYEVHEGRRYGYWNFRHSWVMRWLFPRILLFDAFLAACWRIYLPLLTGVVLVCERFTLDIVTDLSIAFMDKNWPASRLGTRFTRLLPSGSKTIILDLSPDLIRTRRKELTWDRMLEPRLEVFRSLATKYKIPTISTQSSQRDTHQQIISIFGLSNDSE